MYNHAACETAGLPGPGSTSHSDGHSDKCLNSLRIEIFIFVFPLQDFIKSLLVKDPSSRLGGRDGRADSGQDVIRHMFFTTVDWDRWDQTASCGNKNILVPQK